MTLYELSAVYRDSADRLRLRISLLREAGKLQTDEAESAALRSRIAALEPLLREMRELAALTEHYYDRGYYRNEKYIL